MSKRAREADFEVPVVCSLCGTRMYSSLENVGKTMACPDCHTINPIKPPPAKPPPTKPKYTGDEYKLQADSALAVPSQVRPHVNFNCRLCSTLIQVRIEHVGKRMKCPDCGTPNVIPPPPVEVRPFQMPDASDIALDEPPPPIDDRRREIADRLLAEATEELERREREEPQTHSPLETNPLLYAFRLKVIPIWLGMAISLLVLWTMFATVASMGASITPGSVSFEPIMAVFLVVITSLSAVTVAGIFIPHLFTIAVFTADGHDQIPYWPSHDLLERGRALLFAVNGFCLGAAPGMIIALLLNPLGVPAWLGLPFALFFMPIIMLSMMEADSPFTPFSRRVKDSWTQRRESWISFYVLTVGLAVIITFVTTLSWLANPLAGRTILAFSFSIYTVIYVHSLGRLAWVLGEPDNERPESSLIESTAVETEP